MKTQGLHMTSFHGMSRGYVILPCITRSLCWNFFFFNFENNKKNMISYSGMVTQTKMYERLIDFADLDWNLIRLVLSFSEHTLTKLTEES